MKILITSIMDVNKTAPNRLHHFVKYLSDNHHVTILSTNQWWKAEQADVRLYSADFHNFLKNVDVRYFTSKHVGPLLQETLVLTNCSRIMDELEFRNIDVHLDYAALTSGWMVTRKLLHSSIGTVCDLADDVPSMAQTSINIPRPLRLPAGTMSRFIIRKNIEMSRKVTYTVKSLIDAYALPPEKTAWIPNGVDTKSFQNYPAQTLKDTLGLQNSFIVGYLGSLREWIDLEPAFMAVRQLIETHPNIKILVVGEEGNLKINQEIAHTYNLEKYTVFTGTVPFSQAPHYISCMDICLIPFRLNEVAQNALPLKLFEYMACEKPIISTRIRSVVDFAGDMVLYAHDAEEMKIRILELYENERRRMEMGLAGRAFIVKGYSWRNVCQQLETVLQEVGDMKGKNI